MAICRIASKGAIEYGLYRDGQVCPLSGLTDNSPVEGELFDRGPQWLCNLPEPQDQQWVPAPTQMLPPVPMPEKLICIGLNYRDHALETGVTPPSEPVVFSKFNSALIGHGAPIELPSIAHKVDYEAELVVVVGRTAKQVSEAEAMNHVFGYTCGHDISARDWQKGRPGGQWLLGKSFDTFAPLGPCLVTSLECPDTSDLGVRMRLNGQVVQNSTTAQLIFNIPTLLSHLSQVMTLRPGDLIFTGTPPGVGDAKDPPVYLKEGDICSVEIDCVGTLTNRCVQA